MFFLFRDCKTKINPKTEKNETNKIMNFFVIAVYFLLLLISSPNNDHTTARMKRTGSV